MRVITAVTVLLATFVTGVVVGLYLPQPARPETTPEGPAQPTYASADSDAEREHEEMSQTLRYMEQEVADLRTTNSRISRQRGEVQRRSTTTSYIDAYQADLNASRLRQQMDDARRDREAAELRRRQRDQQAEIDAMYRRFTGSTRN